MRRLAGLAMLLVLSAPNVAAAGLAKARPLKTGQTTSYGAAGDTTKGVARSYVDLGNGVIKDRKTGLFWEKKSYDSSIHDYRDIYSWMAGPGSNATGTAFTVFLATLNTPPCFAGYCDWRLPTLNELSTLHDLGRSPPSVPAEFDSGCTGYCTVETCSCISLTQYWSSSTRKDDQWQAWIVYSDGRATYDGKGQNHPVRAVRGGTP